LIAPEFVQVPDGVPAVSVQLMPPVPVTVPVPVPVPVTVTVVRLNVALTDWAVLMVTVQGTVVPVHAPPQPAKAAPDDALGVKLTVSPLTKFAEQVAPQLMPEGELVTVPDAAPAPVLLTVRAKFGAGSKVAVTATGAVPMVKLQAPVPEHTPLQPENTEAELAGVAVNVTGFPLLIALELVQVPEVAPAVMVQLMPPVPVAVPLPVPAPLTVTVVGLNVAVTDCAELMVNEQAPVPVQAPLQPAKADPEEAAGVSATTLPCAKLLLQVNPQLIVPGELVTVPDPDPVVLTVRANVGAGSKVAVTGTGDVPMVKMQKPVPVQAPLHPENTEPALAVGVSVTVLPLLMALEFVQVPVGVPDVIVQLMPPVPVTVPLPVPAPATVAVVRLNEAPTASAEFIVTEQEPIPVQAPLQPIKAEPAGALDVRSTTVPEL
jgi:hypothetical protein